MVRMKGRARAVLKKWRGHEVSDSRQIGKLAQTPTPCSCHMCGNARKWERGKGGSRTRQERREDQRHDETQTEAEDEGTP